ncbi:MAG: hypothetical protein AB7O97_22340 [Planctomycetota bacterium]
MSNPPFLPGRLAAAALAAAQLAPHLPAQQPDAGARRPQLGRVLDGRSPVPGATVTLIGIPAHFDPRAEQADVVTVTADAGGRYRAGLRPGVPYLAFAAAADGADGAFRCAEVRGWFGAGALVDHYLAAASGPYEAELAGGAAWSAGGPLQLYARPTLDSHALLPLRMPCALDDSGGARWPALPFGSFEVTSADGAPLLLAPLRGMPEQRIELPAPAIIAARVVDERGDGIAGAAIWLRMGTFHDGSIDGVATLRRPYERLVGLTDADGAAALSVPGFDPFDVAADPLVFAARAPGRVERLSGFLGRAWLRDDRRVPAEGTPELRFTLSPATPLTGRVQLGSVSAAAGATVRLAAVAKLFGDGMSYTHDPRSYDGVVGDDGTFAIDGVPDHLHSSELVLLTGAGAPIECTGCVEGRMPPAVVDLASIARLRLSVLGIRSGPAAGTAIYVCEVDPPGAPGRGRPRRHCLDGAGRLELSLNSGPWFVLAADETGCAWSERALLPGEDAALELHMQPYPMVAGTLRDDQGAPVGGARVVLRGVQVETSERADRGGDALARALLRTRLERMLQYVMTLDDGSFEIPYLPLDSLTVTVRLAGGGRTTADFRLRGDQDALQLRWQ